ncbi:TPA: fimbrial protein [Proteus mirabilis]|uniref:fimbrial protein n=1 Tax=Proteus mirabilis TaxID=584 RepID=UPI0008DCE194|nr:DUF1120 domain-containing protein [Proteus mirabilis]EKT9691723.1 DUF1120 domain-containing protein [Proteus mirabilis]EKU4146872.1 DUF1120 domain-containing protein [Proteus mirabilis]MBB6687652.1 DUF1120 domain-containing protein [Proteus mirabilis]MBG2744222.1 DUF1120 domain-containing protein [Proteus mirabilis]MBG3037231.1 DUF1120 domain-containing protein [Proteus mirabilis]
MKKLLLSLTMLAIVSTPVLAKPPVANLKINGDIIPPTCTINGGDNDIIIDYGKISPSLIPMTSKYNLGAKEANITISCDAATYLTFVASDTYKAKDPYVSWANSTFGLVNAENTAQEVGGFLIYIDDIKVDDKSVYIGKLNASNNSNSNFLVKDILTGWTTQKQSSADKNNLKLASGKIFSATLRTGRDSSDPDYGYILSRKTLAEDNIDLNDGLDFMGEVVFAFKFGV